MTLNASSPATVAKPSPPPLRAGTMRQWGLLALLTAALETNISETGALAILFPAIRSSLGLTGADLGIMVAANKLTGAVCSPFWIWLARRWNRRVVLVLGAGLWGGWGIGLGFAGDFGWLLFFSCVLAAGFGGAAAVITAVLADLFDDRMRGRAVGVTYGALGLFGAVAAALLGQLAGSAEGWRIGFWVMGGIGLVVGLLMFLLFVDPGIGARDAAPPRSAGIDAGRPAWRDAMAVFRIPSFNLMLLSRLLSGHLVIGTFGVVFLNSVRHFPNDVAVLVVPPFGVGVCLGAVGGGMLADRMHARWPRTGRVAFLQAAQFAFAGVAYVATQSAWEGIGPYMACWLALGMCQSVNPGVNRPIVMSVVPPFLRDWAFVVMLVVVEPIGWALYSFGTGWLGDQDGFQLALLVVLVGIMILNGAAITPLYWTYGRDAARMPGAVPRVAAAS